MLGRALVVALLLAALWPAAEADAARRTFTLRSGPVAMGAFNVAFPKAGVPAPGVDGFIVGMSVGLVDSRGRPVTIRDVMLHHVIFLRRARAVWTACGTRPAEAFYGTGEENQRLLLPPGYGYRTTRSDRWLMQAMLMSHSLPAKNVRVEYRVTVETGRRLEAVRPYWIRASGCKFNYHVWGGGPPGATNLRTTRWRVPVDGRIVAAGGHLHGGSKDMWLAQRRCEGRRLLGTKPRYGTPDHLYYRARPILHEPGPIETGYFLSRTGIGVHRGETLELTGAYDDERAHPRAMAIMHVYIAPGRVPRRACAQLPADRRERVRYTRVRTAPPDVTVPLNALDSEGRTYAFTDPPWPARRVADGATVRLRDFRFSPRRVELPVGGSLVWSFDDAEEHNLTFANGPRLVPGPTLNNGGRYRSTFTVPGRYELFCYLHPLTMHEVVDVTA